MNTTKNRSILFFIGFILFTISAAFFIVDGVISVASLYNITQSDNMVPLIAYGAQGFSTIIIGAAIAFYSLKAIIGVFAQLKKTASLLSDCLEALSFFTFLYTLCEMIISQQLNNPLIWICLILSAITAIGSLVIGKIERLKPYGRMIVLGSVLTLLIVFFFMLSRWSIILAYGLFEGGVVIFIIREAMLIQKSDEESDNLK